MAHLAIVSRDLAKRSRLGAGPWPRSLRETATRFFTPRRHRTGSGDVWALDGVSFEIRPGEVVGFLGRNGAGKTTLLKLLTRVTEPTRGEAELRGRVGALLEVGTGFHPELTGRENIFLSGVILGMSRAEVLRKLDEIVGFSEVERFLDTPIKHYSSGMSMRLAFAVAAHLEPEILIVDEVLAVGDASFQRKCLNKMDSVGREGRTVLFVSHNMPAVSRLCSRAILLEGGHVVADGAVHEVAHRYLSAGQGSTAERIWPDVAAAPGNEVVRLCGVRFRNRDGQVTPVIDVREEGEVELEYLVLAPGHRLAPNLRFHTEDGTLAFITIQTGTRWSSAVRPAGRFVDAVRIPANLLAEGMHFVHVAISTLDPARMHLLETDAVAFQVVDRLEGDSARGQYAGPLSGAVRPLLEWRSSCAGG